jgi:hypothetical protein
MSLKFVRTETFKVTVDVCLPSADPAKPMEGSFVATFRHYNRSAFDALIAEELADREFLDRVLVAVDGIGDENGEPFPAETQRMFVLDELAFGAAAIKAFVGSLAGAQAKNSKASRGR